MEFILLIVLIFSLVSMSNLSNRVSKLEKRLMSAEQERADGIAENVSVSEVKTKTMDMSVEEHATEPSLYTDFPSNSLGLDKPKELTNEEVGGRLLGKIGIFAVLIGLAIFIKYAFDNNWVGPVGKVMVGMMIGVLGIILGSTLRKKYENYSDVLMGGGLGVLYLSSYSAFFFYHLLSSNAAYVILMLITGVSVVLSIHNNTKALAIVGIVCGFLTPVLVSVQTPTFVELLTYILILDVGVVMVSYVYKWIQLNHIAFVGTMAAFIVSAAQHVDQISVGYKMTSITYYSYAFVYFLIFLAASIAHHVVRKENSNQDDIVFIALNGLSHALLGYMLLYPIYPGLMGYFMLFLAVIYSVVAYLSFETHKGDEVLNKFLAGMAALFLTTAIPLHFDGVWIALFWFIEAIIFYVVDKSLKGQNLYSYGSMVYVLGLIQVFTYTGIRYGENPAVFINKSFGLYLVATITAYVLAYILHVDENKTEKTKQLTGMYIGAAQVLTLIAITAEISRFYGYKIQEGYRVYGERDTVISIFWMLYAIFLLVVGFMKNTRFFRIFGLILFVLTAAKIFIQIFTLGPLYAIIASITLGVLALLASFGYAKYSEKLKQLM
ncbi:MAG: DUF2339 domain-containing protein [Candidatus Taylorbacteria bacterium]|nr:DUF2339 domain-containing protein [Candidatus Taylorbacteria bacterium]